MGKRKIGIVGGGAAGCALLWALTSEGGPASEVQATLFHDEDDVGGHSKTIGVWFDDQGTGHASPAPAGKKSYPVDIGVQFVCPTLYPNLYRQLATTPFAGVKLAAHDELKISGAFTDDLNWGNFSKYESGPRFSHCYDTATIALAKKFQHDVHWSPFLHLHGKSVFTMTVGEYLDAAGFSRSSNFFRYLLIPYLSIINGYGTTDLLETTFEDIFPIFTKIPILQEKGPYASFTETGKGWDRFEGGATQWVAAMAGLAKGAGATVVTGATARAVFPRNGKVVVAWARTADVARAAADPSFHLTITEDEFDDVVLTTDMTTNRALLDNPRNNHWAVQRGFISESKFQLIPGVCYIHQDASVLSPTLGDQLEDGQFTGWFSWGKTAPGGNAFDLPYDLSTCFQTYMMQNILGTPNECYVSMYAEDGRAKVPAREKTIFVKTWRHGRWVASFFNDAKKQLHQIQGLGNVWFAGNNTTVDSEEGALVSGMVMAEELSSYEYPFSHVSEAFALYEHFKNMMFPAKLSLAFHLAKHTAAEEKHVALLAAGERPDPA